MGKKDEKKVKEKKKSKNKKKLERIQDIKKKNEIIPNQLSVSQNAENEKSETQQHEETNINEDKERSDNVCKTEQIENKINDITKNKHSARYLLSGYIRNLQDSLDRKFEDILVHWMEITDIVSTYS